GDVWLTGGLPRDVDALGDAARAVVQLRDVPLALRAPHAAQPHPDPEVLDGDVPDVDALDGLVGAVEEDRAPDVGLGLLLPVVLHRGDLGEGDHGAHVGHLDVVLGTHERAVHVVVAPA